MRKILLGTTAVIGAALIGATTAQAQTAPTVRIGGFMEMTGAYINDDNDKGVLAGGANRDKFDFRNESEVHILVNGKAANGISYGAVIEFEMDNLGGAGPGTGVSLDESYLFISSPTLGSIRIGDEDSAASLLQVRVPTIAGMGPDGNWDELLTNRAGNRNGNSYMLSGINDGNDSTKIVYLSPQFFGFDFGVSWAPNTGEGERVFLGASSTVTQRDRTALTNEFSGGLRYRGSFGNIGVTAGLGAMMADKPLGSTAQDVRAYTVGLALTGFGFTVGGEYTWGKYSGASVGRAVLPAGRDDSNHWVLGATYRMGALSFGAYYGQGEQDTNPVGVGKRDQTVWGLGLAYNIAPGLDAIASYNDQSEKRSPDAAVLGGNRDVQVLYAGFRLAF